MVQRQYHVCAVVRTANRCVDKFQRSTEAATNMVELKKVSSYQQSGLFQTEKGGWATLLRQRQREFGSGTRLAEMLARP